MRYRKHVAILSIVVVACALAIYGAFRWAAHRHKLLSGISVSVMPTANWEEEPGHYLWLNRETIVAVTNPPELDWGVSKYSVPSGSCTPFSEVNRCFGGREMHSPFRWAVAPNGKWILFTAGTDSMPLWVAAQVGGHRSLEWLRQDSLERVDQSCAWFPDSSSWVECTPGVARTELKVYSVTNSDRAPTQVGTAQGAMVLLGAVGDRRVVLTNASTPCDGTEISVSTFDAAHGFVTVSQSTVLVPKGVVTIEEMHLSPNGNQIAWVFRYAKHSDVSFIHQALARKLGLSRPAAVGIYVSRVDGSEMREVGHSDTEESGMGTTPYNISWTPDGNCLCYVLQGRLWRVAAREQN